MSRDINPFGVRMPPDLKSDLEQEAKKNSRSLNSEIVDRLKKSLEAIASGQVMNTAAQNTAAYKVDQYSDIEKQLVQVFRKLPAEKQLALLSLFK